LYSYVPTNDSIIIFDSTLHNLEYDKNNNTSCVYSKEEKIRIPDITYIALIMFSKILQEKDKYLIHSSVVKYNYNDALMIVGDANAGKTSMAFKLIKDYNCKLISNDHAIIGLEDNKIKVYAGTKEIQMRLGALKMYFPDLCKKINDNSENIWERKLVVNDYVDNSYFTTTEEDYSTLTDIFNISVYKNGDTFLRRKEDIDQLLFLYNNLSRHIKGTYNLIAGFNYPMPSIETQESLRNLADNCKIMSENCNIYEGKGTLDELSKTMIKKYVRK